MSERTERAANDNASTESEVRRFERHLPHPPEAVWQALTEPTELAAWFPEDLVASPVPPVVRECDPPRVLEMAFGNELLRWEIAPEGSGSVLVLETRSTAANAVRMAA